jgi:hypothetical protein
MQSRTQQSILGCWNHNNNAHVITDARYYFNHPDIQNTDLEPKWFEHIQGKNFVINHKGYPNMIDPLVAKWIKYDTEKLNPEDYTSLSNSKRRFYARLCVKMLARSKFKGDFRDIIKKLDLFGQDFSSFFSQEEAHGIVSQLIDSGKQYIACDLVNRGVKLGQEFIDSLGEFGVLIEYISTATDLGINHADQYSSRADNLSELVIKPYTGYDKTSLYATLDAETDTVERDQTQTIEETLQQVPPALPVRYRGDFDQQNQDLQINPVDDVGDDFESLQEQHDILYDEVEAEQIDTDEKSQNILQNRLNSLLSSIPENDLKEEVPDFLKTFITSALGQLKSKVDMSTESDKQKMQQLDEILAKMSGSGPETIGEFFSMFTGLAGQQMDPNPELSAEYDEMLAEELSAIEELDRECNEAQLSPEEPDMLD